MKRYYSRWCCLLIVTIIFLPAFSAQAVSLTAKELAGPADTALEIRFSAPEEFRTTGPRLVSEPANASAPLAAGSINAVSPSAQSANAPNVAAVPEPGTLALVGVGVLGMILAAKRRRNR